MALTLVVEDGTGLATANVYDLVADCQQWLEDNAFEVFASVSTTRQNQSLKLATGTVETSAREYVEGEPINWEQGLLFPRNNSRNRDYECHELNERPLIYRQGIFVMAEHWAHALEQGRRLSTPSAFTGVKSETLEGDRVEYTGAGPGFWNRYAEAWDMIKQAWPPGIPNRKGL